MNMVDVNVHLEFEKARVKVEIERGTADIPESYVVMRIGDITFFCQDAQMDQIIEDLNVARERLRKEEDVK